MDRSPSRGVDEGRTTRLATVRRGGTPPRNRVGRLGRNPLDRVPGRFLRPGTAARGAINFYAAAPYGFLAKEGDAISLGVHIASRLTGADPSDLFDPASFEVEAD